MVSKFLSVVGAAPIQERTKLKPQNQPRLENQQRHWRAKTMKPRKKASENEQPATKKRKTAGNSSQMNPKQKVGKVPNVNTARWKPLPQSTRDYIAAAIDIAIYNALPLKGSKMEASQEHLSQLKHRFLDRCSSLKVPVSKLKDLRNVQRSCVSKEEYLKEDEVSLRVLQDELDKILKTMEQNSEDVDKLQNEISTLRAFLDETENEQFQNVGVGVLNLPELPEASFQQTTLQEKLMAIGNQVSLRQDLQIIQHCPAMQNLLTFLEHAHAEAENVSPIGH
ncbi:centromere protein Q-like isoform X2 [Chiloscyllium plagiosum]|uniref:centromere protein Q-like isoform X2 n=1 Tax=Chiloscyllium plagiosum TaxID=36176 RepID=UPI001CB805C0|nr:centromere protein Q-like isoform X2 [Chiloscyllium plagiosum]